MLAKEVLTNREIETIDAVLDWLSETGFFAALEASVETWDAYNKWYDKYYEEMYRKNIDIDHGETKYVFILYEFDWVIKVENPRAFNRRHIAYAAKEAEVYEAAVNEGLEQYFAPTYYYKEINNIDVIIQEYVDHSEDGVYNEFYEYCAADYDKDDFTSEDDYDAEIYNSVENMDEYSAIYALFGDIPELRSFIGRNHINDLHAANFGYMGDSPVMIDYCGY